MWTTSNISQEKLIRYFSTHANAHDFFYPQETAFRAHTDRDYVNDFLKEHDIYTELTTPYTQRMLTQYVYVASTIQIIDHWAIHGSYTRIETQKNGSKKSYAAITFTQGFNAFHVKAQVQQKNPIFVIKTEQQDDVYITLADKCLTDFDLLEKAMILSHQTQHTDMIHYASLTIPMVSLDHIKDILWLQGMRLKNFDYQIAHVIQRITFGMDEYGFTKNDFITPQKNHTESAGQCYTINQPFYLWIKRSGSVVPIFAAYIDEQDWKDPNIPLL
jgi:hypothetical protein